jgi:hypothetical protein
MPSTLSRICLSPGIRYSRSVPLRARPDHSECVPSLTDDCQCPRKACDSPSASDAMKPSAGYSTIQEESKVQTFRLFLDLVAQKHHAVFEPGGVDQLQVLRILENARSLAA